MLAQTYFYPLELEIKLTIHHMCLLLHGLVDVHELGVR